MIGVILDVEPVSQIQLKTDGSYKDKRQIMIGDENNVSISATVWGVACEKHDFDIGKVIAMKSCRVSDYNGKSLNASAHDGDIIINVDHPRSNILTKWIGTRDTSLIKRNIKSLSTGGNMSMN